MIKLRIFSCINECYLLLLCHVSNLIYIRVLFKLSIIPLLKTQPMFNLMKKMLLATIENGETKNLKPRGYQIGGKTGTAQIAIQGHYDATKTIASFIGFSPIKHPRFIGLVIVKEPKSSQWGSETAAPIFFNIAKDLIVYYNIAPE